MNENTAPNTQPKFDKPPINEVVCGIHFRPLSGFRAAHFGRLWEKYRSDFPTFDDQKLIMPISQALLSRDKPLLPRVWFIHKDQNEIIQIQSDRFLYNWRKSRPDVEYPHFETIMENFEKYRSQFEEFLREEEIGVIKPLQYELTYIDVIPKGQCWDTLSDIGNVFPNLITLPSSRNVFSQIEAINFQLALALPDDAGRLQVAIRDGVRLPDNMPILQLDITARKHESGASFENIRKWFNQAHESILRLFLEVTSDDIQREHWGKREC